MRLELLLKKKYNYKVESIKKLVGGYRNTCFQIHSGDEKLLLVIYKREEGIKQTIKNAHTVAKFLSQSNFPVRIPKSTNTGKEYIRIKGKDGYHFVSLYNYLEGRTIPWEAYTRRHLKSIGKTLSDMHHNLQQIRNKHQQISQLPKWEEITEAEIVAMKKYFKKVEPWIEKKLEVKLDWEKLEKIFKRLIPDVITFRPNILHYDFVRGNILFSQRLNKKLDVYPITGILDFEKVCIGPEIADIARSLAFLIIDCKFKDEVTVRKRFLISGYERRGKSKLPFAGVEDPVLDNLLCFFWLRDFWKFLVHNPYEDLYINEHYVRTRDRLVESGILVYR